MALKPCIDCGRPSTGSRCPEHTIRNGSTRAWRTTRAAILARDGHACVLCGQPGREVDHVVPVSAGGGDEPSNTRTLCRDCHARRQSIGAPHNASRVTHL